MNEFCGALDIIFINILLARTYIYVCRDIVNGSMLLAGIMITLAVYITKPCFPAQVFWQLPPALRWTYDDTITKIHAWRSQSEN